MKTQVDRLNYIDWLRVGAMFLLLFFHTGRLFDEGAWHIKNVDINVAVNAFNGFLGIWQMPLFFLLAGASVWFALGSRTPGGFTKERVLRLFVPLIFGMLIIVPPQVFIERIFDGDFSGTFLAWYPNTFQGTYSMDNPASGNLSWHHLWFLAYLFVFSLLLIPAFRYFRSGKREPLISRIAGFLEKPGAIFLPAIPLIVINITLRPIYGWGNQNLINDWANFLFYITVVFYGFLLVSDGRILRVIQRNRHTALIAAIVFGTGIFAIESGFVTLPDVIAQWVFLFIMALDCWCWLLAFIGIGSQLLNFSNKVLKYASDAVLPVYILHQTIIVILGYYVIQWDTGVAPKYFFVVISTLLISLAIYEVVRRIGITRFLFGIKTKKRTAAVPTPVGVLNPALAPVLLVPRDHSTPRYR